MVLTKDSIKSLNISQNHIRQHIVNFGSLSNTSDGVFIYDNRDAIIDSVMYSYKWGNKRGVSIERYNQKLYSNDSTNWKMSISTNFHTAGSENSINSLTTYNSNSVIVNEIMYETSQQTEYIEFLNNSSEAINIGLFSVTDEKGNTSVLADTTLFLEPGTFYILASDSSIFNYYPYLLSITNVKIKGEDLGLVNSGELINLRDAFNNSIDSVWYYPKYHTKNTVVTRDKSIERINPRLNPNSPSNWATCVDVFGGTPGKVNSNFIGLMGAGSKLEVFPNPFSPDNDGFEDNTIITYKSSKDVSYLSAKIFDSKGREVCELLNNQPTAYEGSIVYDGLDGNNKPLRIGIYILYMVFKDQNFNEVEAHKKAIVIARKFN